MTQKDFNKLLERRLNLTHQTLAAKSSEYSSGADKLHNFKKTARMRDSHPSLCLQGFLDKHLTSYFDILERAVKGEDIPKSLIDDKIGDIINYFILQEALFEEQNCLGDEERKLFMEGRN